MGYNTSYVCPICWDHCIPYLMHFMFVSYCMAPNIHETIFRDFVSTLHITKILDTKF